MKIRTDALIAVGAALKAAEKNGIEVEDIAKVSLNGTAVDVAAASAALAKASLPEPASDPGFITRTLDKLETRAASLEDKLEKTNLGKRLVALINKDPERVARDGRVEIELKDGRKFDIPVVIVAKALSEALQRVSMTSTALAMTPIVGAFVSAGTAIASGLAALLAAAFGDHALAKSFAGMAAKHGALLAVGFVPVMSNLSSGIALVVDRHDLKDLRKPPSVADIVNLSSFAPDAPTRTPA
ncbi:MAG: hypothetical protein Q8O67_03490 [Deltaproteobacteria bacterium]|nr:hypothetical protein [Deltaproteobacteria bacterium]